MKVEQISVFLENKTGRLSEVTGVLAEAQINIRALSVADTSDFGVLRLLLSDNEKAERVLKEQGFSVSKTEVVAVQVEDQPGGLHKILNAFHESGINIEYMYAFVQSCDNHAVMIFRFDDYAQAIDILKQNGIAMLDPKNLFAL